MKRFAELLHVSRSDSEEAAAIARSIQEAHTRGEFGGEPLYQGMVDGAYALSMDGRQELSDEVMRIAQEFKEEGANG